MVANIQPCNQDQIFTYCFDISVVNGGTRPMQILQTTGNLETLLHLALSTTSPLKLGSQNVLLPSCDHDLDALSKRHEDSHFSSTARWGQTVIPSWHGHPGTGGCSDDSTCSTRGLHERRPEERSAGPKIGLLYLWIYFWCFPIIWARVNA